MINAARPINRYDFYEWCVQAPEIQARFLRARHGAAPKILCDDFSGPAAIARAWALLAADMTAHAIDLESAPLEHARLRAGEQRIPPERFLTHQQDVRRAALQADVIAAFNFAVCEFHQRDDLLAYLRQACARLNKGGVLALDLYGGANAYTLGQEEKTVRTPRGNVLYTWEQAAANPLTARVHNRIHFEMPDGTTHTSAFEYDWRLWTPAELKDALHEAGFRSVETHATYGGALDEAGDPIALDEPEIEIDDDFVVYLIARAA